MTSYVLTIDDHPLFRQALKLAVQRAAPETETVEAACLADAKQTLAARGRPLLTLLDLRLPDADGFSGLLELKMALNGAPIALVSGDESPGIAASAMKLGAAGFIAKSSSLETIVDAVTHLIGGMTWFQTDTVQASAWASAERLASLTTAQQRVLVGLQKGLLNKQIAYESGISEATVKAHMTAIFRKLGVHSRTQAVLAAKQILTSDLV